SAYGSPVVRCERRTRARSTAKPAARPAAARPTAAPTMPALRRRLTVPILRSRRRSRDEPVVEAGYPGGAEPGDDLVVDRVDRGGPVVGGGLAVVARAEDHRHVALAHLVVAAVQHDLVHADPAGDPADPAGEQHRADAGGMPGDAVGVAERD